MNYLLDRIFSDGYEVAFNVNVDDYYAPTRFERQVHENILIYQYYYISTNILVYEVVFNVNVNDYYAPTRFERQVY